MQPSLASMFKQHSGIDFWPVWILIGVLRLLSWLPFPVQYLLGTVIGEVIYWLFPSRRSITHRNLTACFPNKNKSYIRGLARGHFRCLVIAVLVTGVTWWGSSSRLDRLTRFRNREIFDQALSQGQNIILLAPHFSGLEYGGVYLSNSLQMVSMYQRNKNPLLDELIKQHRSRFGGIQYASKDPIKSMIKMIRRGDPFYYLPDQDPGRNKGVFALFYSIPTATFPALGRIARMSNSIVIPCATVLLPWGQGYEIIFNQPLTDYPSGDDVQDATQMNQAIEALIAYAPQQYLWSHKRFKTRPEGDPPFYK